MRRLRQVTRQVLIYVVYFNQQLGALHAVCWLKSSLLACAKDLYKTMHIINSIFVTKDNTFNIVSIIYGRHFYFFQQAAHHLFAFQNIQHFAEHIHPG